MKELILAFQFATLSLISLGQEPSYNFIPEEDKKVIFKDDFSSDQGIWTLVKGKVKNGAFDLTSKGGGGRLAMTNPKVDYSKDFEIETSVRYNKGNSGATIVFGVGKNELKNNFDYKVFYFNQSEVGIGTYANAKWGLINSKRTNYLKDDFNKMTIRKIQDYIYYYFNESLIFTTRIPRFYGTSIAIEPPFEGSASFDYVKVSYFDLPPPNWYVENTHLQDNGKNGKLSSGEKAKLTLNLSNKNVVKANIKGVAIEFAEHPNIIVSSELKKNTSINTFIFDLQNVGSIEGDMLNGNLNIETSNDHNYIIPFQIPILEYKEFAGFEDLDAVGEAFNSHFARVIGAFNNDDYDKALNILNEIIDRFDRKLPRHNNINYLRSFRLKFREEREHRDIVLISLIYQYFGRCSAKLEKDNLAIEYYDEAIEFDSNYQNHLLKANLLDILKRPKQALIEYNKCLESYSENSFVWYQKAMLEFQIGSYDKGCEAMQNVDWKELERITDKSWLCLGKRSTFTIQGDYSGVYETNIDVSIGDKIWVYAQGKIKLGAWAGWGSVEGINGYQSYNRLSGANHGALLIGYAADNSFTPYSGYWMIFDIEEPGYLKFAINDKDFANNSGSFNLMVIKAEQRVTTK